MRGSAKDQWRHEKDEAQWSDCAIVLLPLTEHLYLSLSPSTIARFFRFLPPNRNTLPFVAANPPCVRVPGPFVVMAADCNTPNRIAAVVVAEGGTEVLPVTPERNTLRKEQREK